FTEVHDETLHGHDEEPDEFCNEPDGGEDNQRQTSRQVANTLSPCHTEPPFAGSNASATLWSRRRLSRPAQNRPQIPPGTGRLSACACSVRLYSSAWQAQLMEV